MLSEERAVELPIVLAVPTGLELHDDLHAGEGGAASLAARAVLVLRGVDDLHGLTRPCREPDGNVRRLI